MSLCHWKAIYQSSEAYLSWGTKIVVKIHLTLTLKMLVAFHTSLLMRFSQFSWCKTWHKDMSFTVNFTLWKALFQTYLTLKNLSTSSQWGWVYLVFSYIYLRFVDINQLHHEHCRRHIYLALSPFGKSWWSFLALSTSAGKRCWSWSTWVGMIRRLAGILFLCSCFYSWRSVVTFLFLT